MSISLQKNRSPLPFPKMHALKECRNTFTLNLLVYITISLCN